MICPFWSVPFSRVYTDSSDFLLKDSFRKRTEVSQGSFCVEWETGGIVDQGGPIVCRIIDWGVVD